MIFDLLDNLAKYPGIPCGKKIAAFLASTDVHKLTEGDIPIDGDDLYVKVLHYVPKKEKDNLFETHNIYADVQVMVDGTELMQTAHPESLIEKKEYNADGDFQFSNARGGISDLVVCEGQFVVFFPGEPHKPGCIYSDSEKAVTKLVFKSKSFFSNQTSLESRLF